MSKSAWTSRMMGESDYSGVRHEHREQMQERERLAVRDIKKAVSGQLRSPDPRRTCEGHRGGAEQGIRSAKGIALASLSSHRGGT